MFKRARGLRGLSESEIMGAADAKEQEYRNNFGKFWKARGLEVDVRASDAAWQKTRAKAAQLYAQMRMRASAPPLPATVSPATDETKPYTPVTAPVEERILVKPLPEDPRHPDATMPPPPAPPQTQEQPLAILDAAKWFVWDSVVFTPENYHQFVAAFVPELGKALGEMPTDLERRTYMMETVKNLFMQKLFTMYCNQYPNRSPEELRENVQAWLDDNWKRTLATAQLFK